MTSDGSHIRYQFSSLCSLLNRASLMTGFLRDILSRHFYNSRHIEDDMLRECLWRPDESTGIVIESSLRFRPELVETRPAIIIHRNPYQNMRRGIADVNQGSAVDQYGNQHFATFWVGSHTLFCIGGSGNQVERLSTEVQRELTEFTSVIVKNLNMLRFQVLQVGAISILEEAQENFVVPVTVGYNYEERWKIQQQAPLLSDISLSMILEM